MLSINQNTIIFVQANASVMFHAKCQLFFSAINVLLATNTLPPFGANGLA